MIRVMSLSLHYWSIQESARQMQAAGRLGPEYVSKVEEDLVEMTESLAGIYQERPLVNLS